VDVIVQFNSPPTERHHQKVRDYGGIHKAGLGTVSGAAALLLEKDGSLSPDTVKARLMKTATKSFPATSTATDPVTGQMFTSQYDLFTIGATSGEP